MRAFVLVALAILLPSACAFGAGRPSPRRSKSSVGPLMAQDGPIADVSTSRRGLFQKGLGIGIIGLAIANKIAIRGPPVFTPAEGSLAGKTIVITGGNNGLGKEAAIRLAKGAASVVITVRTDEKGRAAVQEIKEQSGNSNVYYMVCDLADLASVKSAPAEFKKLPLEPKIDVLMNNAGVMAIPTYQTTKDGFEKQFGINHLGHFALTAELFPFLKAASNSRIINLSSSAHLGATEKDFNTPELGMEPEKYTQWGAYCRSKLANVLFTKELDRKIKEAKLDISTVAVHPGAVRTELARYLTTGEDKPTLEGTSNNPLAIAGLLLVSYFTKSVDRGANSQVWLATDSEKGGTYNGGSGEYFQNLKPGFLNPTANNMELAERLWGESERLTGTSFNVK